jgi:enterochelin esterase-like enzyme
MSILLLLTLANAREDRLSYVTLDSAVEQRPMTYGIYEPPGWDHTTPLPLVVFLHGGGDDERALDDHPVVTRALDRWITEGRLPPVLVVVPDGERGFWRNWADGSHRFADWVVDEVIPDAQRRLPVQPDQKHLMGISMGGAGTMYIGLDHLDTFASLTVLSAPLFDADTVLRFLSSPMFESFAPMQRVFGTPDPAEVQQNNAWTRLSDPAALGDTVLYVGAGTVDLGRIGPLTRDFHDHLAEAGVAHRYHAFPGGHRWVDWAKVFPVALCYATRGDACEPGRVTGRLVQPGTGG